MQLGLGCKEEGAPANIKQIVMQQFQNASKQIPTPGKETGEFHPGFLHEWNDLKAIYGENWNKLREVKDRFDPRNRFCKGLDLVAGRVSEKTTV